MFAAFEFQFPRRGHGWVRSAPILVHLPGDDVLQRRMNTRAQLVEMPSRDIGPWLAFLVGSGNKPGMVDSDDVASSQSLAKLLLEFSQCAAHNGIDRARFAHI